MGSNFVWYSFVCPLDLCVHYTCVTHYFWSIVYMCNQYISPQVWYSISNTITVFLLTILDLFRTASLLFLGMFGFLYDLLYLLR